MCSSSFSESFPSNIKISWNCYRWNNRSDQDFDSAQIDYDVHSDRPNLKPTIPATIALTDPATDPKMIPSPPGPHVMYTMYDAVIAMIPGPPRLIAVIVLSSILYIHALQ